MRESDPLHARLEADLQAAAQLRYLDVLSVLSVGIDAHLADQCTAYLVYHHWDHELAGLDDAALRAGLDALVEHAGEDFELRRVQLRLYDGDDDQVCQEPLIDMLQMQIEREGDLYVRVERRWFRCREDYVQRLAGRISAILDLSADLALPPWDKNIHRVEEDYNEYIAEQKDWLLQDQKFFYHGGQKLEPCDVLSPQRHFVHVKEGHSSALLSHLFGQASAAANLLRYHQPYYAEVRRRFEQRWPEPGFEQSGRPTIVLAIARRPGGDLLGDLLISKLNLLEHVRRIRSHNCEVAVCKVDLLPQRAASPSPVHPAPAPPPAPPGAELNAAA